MLYDLCSGVLGCCRTMGSRRKVLAHPWVATRKTLAAALLVILLVAQCCLAEEFEDTSNDGLNHIAVDSGTGRVYVGGVNALYQLDSSLGKEKEVDTSESGGDNVNKILVVDSEHGQLVTCGSRQDGRCQLRQLDDISDSVSYHDTSRYLPVAANTDEDSTVAFLGPGPSDDADADAVLYVGVTATDGSLRERVPAVGSINLQGGRIMRISYEDPFASSFGTKVLFNDHDEAKKTHNKIEYKAGFSVEGFSYFLTQQPNQFTLDPSSQTITQSKIIQVCQNDKEYSSYVEVPIICEQDGDKFDLVKVTKTISPASTLNNRDPIVVGVFSSSSVTTEMAVCVFKLEEIRKAFTDSIKECYKGNDILAPQFKPGQTGSCPRNESVAVPDDNCGSPFNHINPLAGSVRLVAQAIHVYEDTDITALALDVIGDDTVAFLGTSDGHVKKVILARDGQDAISEFADDTVQSGHGVRDIVMAPDEEHFYVLTDEQVFREKIAECGGHEDCAACQEAGNPYCGWCSLEDKCSVRAECTNYAQNNRYLTYDLEECLVLNRVSPEEVSVDQEDTRMHVYIQRLPPLQGSNKYKCLFSNVEVSGSISSSDSTQLRCGTPSKEDLPDIAEDTDNMEVPLKVKSTETDVIFLETTFTFYECGKHDICSVCTQSQWKCRWCIYDNRCVDDDTDCAENSYVEDERSTECPQLFIPDTPMLIPAGHSTEVVLPGGNIPDLLGKYEEYKCIFSSVQQSGDITVTGRKNGDNIYCDEHEYSYEQDISLRYGEVQVQWNGGYVLEGEPQVLVYKCEQLGNDCSSCNSLNLGEDTKYGCRWCGESCSFKDSCTAQIEDTCPGPSVTKVEPLSAPIDGGTRITISGQNLGTSIDDVISVTLATEIDCAIDRDAYEVSTKIVCETGPAAEPVDGAVMVNIRDHNPGSYDEEFSYRNPKLLNVSPLLGPESGGSSVTITGEALQTGAEQKILMGNCMCVIDSLEDGTVTCITEPCEVALHDIVMKFDGVERTYSEQQFEYTADPKVTKIQPTKSFVSGGRVLTVKGTDLDSVQKPIMILDGPLRKEVECTVKKADRIDCVTPKVLDENDTGRRKRAAYEGDYDISFVMDGLDVDVPDSYDVLQFIPDPILYPLNRTTGFEGVREHHHRETTLELEGDNLNAASTSSEITVTIGDVDCPVNTVDDKHIYCEPPVEQPGDGGTPPAVVVKIGNLEVTLGKLKYVYTENKPESTDWIIGVAVGGGILITIIIIILIIYKRKSTEAERQYKKMQMQLDTLESNVRNECKQAFAELQTEVTDFTSDITVIGIPFWDYRSYTFKVLFPSHTDHPVLHNSSDYYTTKYGSYDQGLHQFNQLLNSKQFLLIFIRTLEQQRNFSIRDRAVVASLLMIVLQDKMEYATEIMKALLNELVDKSVEKKHPKLMLRRTESVVEKLLTNWLSLSMYGYLKKHAGKSLFMLCRAIKHQTEKGPVDAISSEARYSLSEDRLLREKISPNTLTVQLVTDDGREPITCKVLDCDTITQAKEKSLDAIYLNTPFSKRPSVYDVDLEWRSGRSGHLPLQDEDVTTENVHGYKKCNTLLHYHVPDGAIMALVPKKNKNDMVRQVHGMVEITSTSLSNITPIITVEEGTKVWHLVKHDDNMHVSREKKVISEIFLTRLLATKGTLQQFIDDLFLTILKVDSSLPPAVKYLFDFLDTAARRHNIVDPDVVHTWKSNSLPLRFWVNILKNPEFVFDIHKSHIVDSCLSVIAQTFMDSCSTSEHKLGKDSPSNKLLFAKDIPKYRGWVSRFYKGVQQMPTVSDAEITQVMTELSMTHNVDFNIAVALKDLYKYATQYNFELLEALDDDPSAKKLHLANKFEQAVAVIEGQPLY